jgi:hypothetical protein
VKKLFAIIFKKNEKFLIRKWNENSKQYKYTDTRAKLINGIAHIHPVGIYGLEIFICCPYCGQFHKHTLNRKYKGPIVPGCIQRFDGKKYVIEYLVIENGGI